MKSSTRKTLLLTVCALVFISNVGHAAIVSTETKLNLVQSAFRSVGYTMSNEFLARWRAKTGGTRTLQIGELNTTQVQLALSEQRGLVIAGMQRDLAQGIRRPGTTYTMPLLQRSMARGYALNDWYFAVGGCVISTSYRISVSGLSSNRVVTCTIPSWNSFISDDYTFGASDAYGVVFSSTELLNYEKDGKAKRFSVASVGFSSKASIASFTVQLR